MKDLLDILLDEEDIDPVVLTDGEGTQVEFEQVAVISHDINNEIGLYAILKPLNQIEGIADDEAVVFKVVENDNGQFVLHVEVDEMIAIEIFNIYYDMFEEEHNNKRK